MGLFVISDDDVISWLKSLCRCLLMVMISGWLCFVFIFVLGLGVLEMMLRLGIICFVCWIECLLLLFVFCYIVGWIFVLILIVILVLLMIVFWCVLLCMLMI